MTEMILGVLVLSPTTEEMPLKAASQKLQLVHNTATQLLSGTNWKDHIMPGLLDRL